MMMEMTGAGAGGAHRDINGRRRRAGAGGGGRGGSRVDTGGAIHRAGHSELVALSVDDVDVGAVDAADLVAPFRVGVTGDLDGVRKIRGRNVQRQGNVRWGPGHKVPEIQTEVGGIGIDTRPLDVDGGPGCVGRVGRRAGDLDGACQRAERDDQRNHGAHHFSNYGFDSF